MKNRRILISDQAAYDIRPLQNALPLHPYIPRTGNRVTNEKSPELLITILPTGVKRSSVGRISWHGRFPNHWSRVYYHHIVPMNVGSSNAIVCSVVTDPESGPAD